MKKWRMVIIGLVLMFFGMLYQPVKSHAASPGLYNSNGQMVYSWNQLTNESIVKGGILNVYNGSLYLCDNGPKYLKGKLVISDSVKEIGGYAFMDCNELIEVTLPNTVKTIEACAFYNSGIKKITIPQSVTSIGNCIFAECDALKEIKINSKNKIYNSNNNCNAIIKTSSKEVVAGCSESVIPSGVKKINDWAFFGLLNLEKITIPDSVTTIGEYAFFGCANLKNITIPKSVTKIGDNAFGGIQIVHNNSSAKGKPWGAVSVHNNSGTGCSLCSIKIIFNPNGGTVSKYSKTVSKGYTYGALPTPTRKGYDFKGWYTAKSGGNKVSASNYVTRTTNQMLYAQWQLKKYTITYDFNGGSKLSGKTYPSTYTITKEVTFPNATRKGHTFVGWYKDKNFKNKTTNIAKGSTGNKTVYAKWKANSYKVAFNANGGSGKKMTTQSFTYGTAKALKANTYTKKGYKFAGWATSASGKAVYSNKQQLKKLTSTNGKTVTLYAKWELVKYKITYKYNGGEESKEGDHPATYTVKSEFSLKEATRKGYSFKGWYTDKDFKNKITDIKKGTTGAKTLYAKWTANTYSVKFIGAGATGGTMDVQKHTYGTQKVLKKNAFTKKGHRFLGWATSENGSVKYTDGQSVENLTTTNEKTIKLYACWGKNLENYMVTAKYKGNYVSENAKVVSYKVQYKDEYFLKEKSELQGGLAKLSMAGASAAYKKTYAKDFLDECGFDNIGYYFSDKDKDDDDDSTIDDNDHVKYAVGAKTITSKTGTTYTVIAVLVKGTSANYEWISNFNLGTGKYHAGFKMAKDEVLDELIPYIQKHQNGNPVKIWITGHSRGAAVANLIAADLNGKDKYKAYRDVYAYTFATPRVADKSVTVKYDNIFNYLNPGDFVTEVAPEDWGYARFGEDKTLTAKTKGEMKEKFKELTGVEYKGFGEKGKMSLVDAFCRYGKSKDEYDEVLFLDDISPQEYCQDGLAMVLAGKTLDGIAVMTAASAENDDALILTGKLIYDGKLVDKFRHAHCMSSYVAWLETMYK